MARKKVKCGDCDKVFQSAYHLKIHSQAHEPSASKSKSKSPQKSSPSSAKKTPFKCNRCTKGFPSKYSLRMHQKLQCHPRLLKCNSCPKTFVYQSALDNHISTKHKKSPKELKPSAETKTSEKKTTNSPLVEHVEVNKKKTDPGNKLVLNLHINLGELSEIIERLYKCNVCGDLFASEDLLKSHLEEEHEDEAQSSAQGSPTSFKKKELFGCQLCNGKYTSRTDFINHMKLHEAEECHTCDVCTETFQDEESLKAHRKTHIKKQEPANKKPSPNIKQKTHPCKICTVIFPSEEALKSHAQKHVQEKLTVKEDSDEESDVDDPDENTTVRYLFRCEYCEKLFESSRALGLHIQTHPGVVTIIQCESCPKKFASENDYKDHKATHVSKLPTPVSGTISKPANPVKLVGVKKPRLTPKKAEIFQCDVCNEAMPDEASLGYHKTHYHSDDKPFKCHVCQNVFPKSRFLKCHLRMVHKM